MEKEKLETEKAAPSKVSGEPSLEPSILYPWSSLPIFESGDISTEKFLDSYVVVQVMTTSERLLVGGSKTPPDTAPRLPPKPGKCWNQGWIYGARIESRRNIVQYISLSIKLYCQQLH